MVSALPAVLEQISRGVFKVNPGSLLTALERLARAGWLDAKWRQDRELPPREVLYPHPRGKNNSRSKPQTGHAGHPPSHVS